MVSQRRQRKTIPRKPWYSDSTHKDAFDAIKQQLAREVMFAYPDYSLPFDINDDASLRQLGAVITQQGTLPFCGICPCDIWQL